MRDPDLRGYRFRPEGHQDLRRVAQLLRLALNNNAGLSRDRLLPHAHVGPPTASVDPNFRQLSRVSPIQNRDGLGNDVMTSNPSKDLLRS